MALSKDDILNAIAEMSVMDVVELVSAMEEKFGVTAAAAAQQLLSRQLAVTLALAQQQRKTSLTLFSHQLVTRK